MRPASEKVNFTLCSGKVSLSVLMGERQIKLKKYNKTLELLINL